MKPKLKEIRMGENSLRVSLLLVRPDTKEARATIRQTDWRNYPCIRCFAALPRHASSIVVVNYPELNQCKSYGFCDRCSALDDATLFAEASDYIARLLQAHGGGNVQIADPS